MSAPTFFVPEVVQSSAMDCGPAALCSLLEGFGIGVSYGRLREACQTDVDGTSIDTLEDVALTLGLEVEQVVLPLDHVLRKEAGALPAVIVVTLPGGGNHFVVVWRVLGPWVQIMDPSSGRLWVRRSQLLDQLYLHAMPAPPEAWLEWAQEEEFQSVLRARMLELGCRAGFVHEQLHAAKADAGWFYLARLDASVRMLDDLVAIDGLTKGEEVERSVVELIRIAGNDPRWIPELCWSARPFQSDGQEPADPTDCELALVRGAVVLRASGRRPPLAATSAEDDAPPTVSADVANALEAVRPAPGRALLRMMAADGLLRPSLVLGAMVAASVGVLLEAVILRAMIEMGTQLGLVRERVVAWVALVLFAFVLLLLETVAATEVRGLGRRLENRLRVAFLTKVPRLGARYFHSRLSSDMAERIHAMHGLRRLPALGEQVLRTTATAILTVAGVAWLDPGAALFAGGGALVLLAVVLGALPILRERDLRFRTHGGALSRVYLDALQGLWPIRAHGAARAVRREHERLLIEWMRAGVALVRASVTVEVLQGLVGAAAVIFVVTRHSLEAGEVGAMLLLIYWSMQLPALGQQLGTLLRQYPGHRSRAVRLLEPLGAADHEGGPMEAAAEVPAAPGPPSVRFEGVTIVAGGHALLHGVDLEILAGEHVAIVGASGAGKSTLIGTLLGWHRPAIGRVLVDGVPLQGPGLVELRQRTAWVDPAVALWNEPLVDNLLYGSDQQPSDLERALDGVGTALEDADLRPVVASLPDGLQTELGEGGGLVSGGEGQRVRMGRALLRPRIGLALLDEPLRGLDRERRVALLQRLRQRWSEITLLCVTHDLEETAQFPRVIVIDDGRVVEDGDPATLAMRPGGVYAAMLAQERRVQSELWRGPQWRRLDVRDGQLTTTEPAGEDRTP
ncbi:MAG: ATP-binding cassette domain-containing protein [Deltaproteobacteria bacterium]|nr:ATP-binding cassette domain-containing protein [Deltaproteobacteria bacterium]